MLAFPVNFLIKAPSSFVLLLVLLSCAFNASSLPIRQVKPFPSTLNFINNQKIRLNPRNYFAGFSLSFYDTQDGQKMILDSSVKFDRSVNFTSARSIQTLNGSTIIILDESCTILIHIPDGKTFLKPFRLDLENASVCYDLEFLNQDIVVVDCDLEERNIFYFISLHERRVITSMSVDGQYARHTSRKLIQAKNFKDSDLILFIASNNTDNEQAWQLNLLKFAENYTLTNLIQLSPTDFSSINSTFKLHDVKSFGPGGLLLAGSNTAYWVYQNDSLHNILGSFLTNSLALGVSVPFEDSGIVSALVRSEDNNIYELLFGTSKGVLSDVRPFVDTIYSPKNVISNQTGMVKHIELTKDFVFIVTGGDDYGIYIYNRGDTNNNEIFCFMVYKDNEAISPLKKIISIPDENKIIWITADTISIYEIQNLWYVFTGKHWSGNTTLRIQSKSDLLRVELSILSDSRPGALMRRFEPYEMKFAKTWTETIDALYDKFFTTFSYIPTSVMRHKEVASSPNKPMRFSIGNMNFSYISIHYDSRRDTFRLYHQSPGSQDIALYACQLDLNKTTPSLQCLRQAHASNVGKVLKVHSKKLIV